MALVQPVFAAGMAALAATNAHAQNADAATSQTGFGSFEFSSSFAVVSDYRGRGVSYSEDSLAVQGALDVAEPSGWSAGLWTSTIGEFSEADFELDIYAARTFALGSSELTLGATAFVFPEGDNWDYGEAQASLSQAIGPVDATLSINYAWEQANLADEDDLYVALKVITPIGSVGGAPISLSGSIGYEEGAFAIEDDKVDWSLSVTAEVERIEFGVSFVDSDLEGDRGEPAWVFSISRSF